MPKVLNMQLSNKSTKPVFITLTPSGKRIKCMLDTGADMPVWCGSGSLLKIVFPEIVLSDKKFIHCIFFWQEFWVRFNFKCNNVPAYGLFNFKQEKKYICFKDRI